MLDAETEQQLWDRVGALPDVALLVVSKRRAVTRRTLWRAMSAVGVKDFGMDIRDPSVTRIGL